MDEHPVRVGDMLFTMVDPNPGHEVAYNRWYERDHFYAGCMVGPGILAGRRWAAPSWLKDLRFPDPSPFAEPLRAGSYLAVYWKQAGHQRDWSEFAGPQVWWLYQNGRGFPERTHAHTAMYDFVSSVNADPDGIPIELALDHDYGGLAVVSVEPAAGQSPSELCEALENGPVGPLFDGGIDLVSSWSVVPAPEPAPDQEARSPMDLGASGGTERRLVQLMFLEEKPGRAWPVIRAYADDVAGRGLGTVTFAAPFIPTVAGTDTYTDQLW